MKLFILFFLWCFSINSFSAPVIKVSLSEKVKFAKGDVIELINEKFSIIIGFDEGSKCAVPGFNCGSGYIPPHPTYTVNCGERSPCPYIFMAASENSFSGTISIESLKSCETHEPERCYLEFANGFKEDKECMNISNLNGRYYCLKKFEHSKLPENKNLCDSLSDSVYALKWNCYYEYAIRYNDPALCEKYQDKEIDGKNRCFLKMAELNRDKKLCNKIVKTSQDSYLEQCLQFK
jgi:hypothetical protein